ncbi:MULTISPECIES: hypothetical protein [unclassified Bradyrhizobium]|uniref:hypothetical protein n=1 Tax=unclassified Bradyrhizobium TaxID=2631580 RepID=UPI0012EBF570|nr:MULTISPECIES: hypothetical protein [unclassified Bradyrhizobium]QIG96971.1 hypothetical protein G6P99_34245 [Bradyrhizobium sp. 6(2017)]
MAFTAGLKPTIAVRALTPVQQRPASENKTAAFAGGTCSHSMLRPVGVNRQEPAFAGLPAMRNERNPEHSGAVEKPHYSA